MSKSDIAELLAIAYTYHCAACSSNGSEPVSYDNFIDWYKETITDVRCDLGVGEPYTG